MFSLGDEAGGFGVYDEPAAVVERAALIERQLLKRYPPAPLDGIDPKFGQSGLRS
jgi:hypothetical protein